MKMKSYGKELIIDIHDVELESTRGDLERFFTELCDLIDMVREDLHFWDYDGEEEAYKNAPAHLKGISAIQFIRTSSIVIHTLDDLHKVFINIFSCKDFEVEKAISFCKDFFIGNVVNFTVVERQ